MNLPKITYEELMSEFAKHERAFETSPEQEKAIIEARDKYNVSYAKIAEILNEKYGTNFKGALMRARYEMAKKETC